MSEGIDPQAEAQCRGLAEDLGPLLGGLVVMLRRDTNHLAVTPAQATVLATLRDGSRRISDLSEYAGVTQPTMTVLIDRMERQHWVERVVDPGDRRAVRVQITPEGREAIGQLVAARADSLAHRLVELTPGQRAALAEALPALAALIQ